MRNRAIEQTEPNGLSEDIDVVLKKLMSPAYPSANGQRRRFPKGAPREPWIEEAKAELKAAVVPSGIWGFRQRLQAEGVKAVPHDFHDALLMCVGVTSYRSG